MTTIIEPSGQAAIRVTEANEAQAMHIIEVNGSDALEALMTIATSYTVDDNDIERTREVIGQELAECGDNRRVFVAYKYDEPVAFVELVLKHADNDPELADGDAVAHAHNLQVHRNFQGRGIGTEMMHYLEMVARAMGKRKLTLGVDASNTRASRLYDKLGWMHLKDCPGPTPEQDGLYMYKDLDSQE
ncbi:MAG: GNAT family N-acetyltransferase [candidate division Zixibacteria bacterium]|nr:GNAT family N-acetyltransferase [candidate division Zixibacteria bacterium]